MTVKSGKAGLSISLQVDDLLDEYSRELEEEVEKIAAGVAKAAANKLRKHSPRGKGGKHYADGWRWKRVSKKNFVVYNETKPGLTHLLNNGHAKINGGEVKGDGHINDVDEWAAEEFVNRVKKKI